MGTQGSAKVDSTTECVPFVTAEGTETWSRSRVKQNRGHEAHDAEGIGGFTMCRRTIENDEIANIRSDSLRLEDQAGVLIGAISTNYDGYSFGRGKQNEGELGNPPRVSHEKLGDRTQSRRHSQQRGIKKQRS
jgi:hypothetical protein